MQTRVIDLNCKEKEYQFNLSVITESDWENLAHSIVLEMGRNVKELELTGYKVVIRDNKVKFKVFFQDDAYHELEYHLDALGRKSKSYQDVVSILWNEVMEKYYGAEYAKFVELKLGKSKTQTKED